MKALKILKKINLPNIIILNILILSIFQKYNSSKNDHYSNENLNDEKDIKFENFKKSLSNIESKSGKYLKYKILLNSKNEIKISSGECFYFRINQLFKNVKIEIFSENINKLIITNRKITDIHELESKDYPVCKYDNLICYEHVYPSKIEFSSKYCGISTYIYGCTYDSSENVDDNSSKENSDTNEDDEVIEKKENLNVLNYATVNVSI